MGQKVHPIGMRLGITQDWNAVWYAERQSFAENLRQDMIIRKLVNDRFGKVSLSGVKIERSQDKFTLTVLTARPGAIIGPKGQDIERLRLDISKIIDSPAFVNVEENRKPDLEASLVAESVASQLERRVMFRRAMKRAVGNAMRQGAEGIKIAVGGRLNGADIARTEWYREGRVPLHTLRADISYGFHEANTTYGKIGVKVWVFRGEILQQNRRKANAPGNQERKKV